MGHGLRRIALAVLVLPLAAFFAFVGWSKAFAPLSDLARYQAWTVYLPEWLGRLVGWSEMGLALVLLAALVPRSGRSPWWAAVALIVNQLCAALVHAWEGQLGALPQNGLLVILLAAAAWFARPRFQVMGVERR